MITSIKVRAPSSTANLGPGFDVFGLALDAFYDEIIFTKTSKSTTTNKPWHGIRILTTDDVPKEPQQNTAGLVIKAMKQKFKIKSGIEIKIKKGVPAGFGMGSSAASAAAAALGFNRLFNLKLDNKTLIKFAGIGEKASAGTIHYDNVAASLLGGFVVVKTKPFDVIRLEPPKDLVLCVAIPKIRVPKKKTKISRSVLPKTVKLSDLTVNLSNAANIVSGFLLKDSDLIGRSIQDVIVEPARKHLIPGFSKVKNNALNAGALGVTISGAGPSVIAFCKKSQNLKKIGKSMERGFGSAKVGCDVIICKPSVGPRISRSKL
ncbi:MAG: homoserine kinase [Thaumarchaeota archaeon]|jgi:homoserine kinase|nr:MAG: homoserine kinase [Nitrososphaerota archaeon]